jgi:hypothetical protein
MDGTNGSETVAMDGSDYVVLDVEDPQFVRDCILNPDYEERSTRGTFFSCFAQRARECGVGVLTADVFLAERPSFRQAVSLSNEFTSFLPRLVQVGVKPGLLVSGESPNVARKFYEDLPGRSAPFRHACLFRGSLSRLAPGVEGHPYLYPFPASVLAADRPWAERRVLGFVAGFKGAWIGPRSWPKSLPAVLRSRWRRLREPSLRMRNLYGLRLELVRRFGPKPGFVLRGTDWERSLAGRCAWYRRPFEFSNRPAPCEDKLAVLGECRFALAIENAAYPGYVTEKVFDAFRAGAVPVYLGAPDIEDFVPAGCFIDLRRFATPELLWSHLAGMPENQWIQYREAARVFMISDQYREHLEERVARRWMEWLSASSS